MEVNTKLKPEDLLTITDTRESNPLNLSPLRTERKKLDTGDYSCAGMEEILTVEVKELGDFVQCCTFHRDRFERELQRMREYKYKAIVVKSTWGHIERKAYRGATNPLAVLGSAMGFAMTANVPIIMAEDHHTAGRLVARFLWVAANRHQKSSA